MQLLRFGKRVNLFLEVLSALVSLLCHITTHHCSDLRCSSRRCSNATPGAFRVPAASHGPHVRRTFAHNCLFVEGEQ